MSEPAAILATFSDLKLVKTRKVAQLVFEVPIESVRSATEALGWPTGEQWCGIARITKPGPTPQLDKGSVGGGAERPLTQASAAPSPKPNSTRAVMMAKDLEFQKWAGVNNEAGADSFIKLRCEVKSKSDLNEPPASEKFALLRREFNEWRRWV